MQESQLVALGDLPDAVGRYLDGADLTAFTDDATVVDEGHTYTGTEAIEKWSTKSAGEYTYTVKPIAVDRIDATHWTVTQHLEGDFPGGVVDLHFRFGLRDGLIEHLVIEP